MPVAGPRMMLRAGGRVLRKFGTLAVRRSPRGWDTMKETVTRASVGAYLDGAGKLRSAAVNTLRPWPLDTDGDGVFDELGVVVDDGSTNLCPYSQDFTQWLAENGTPTRGTPLVYGDLQLELLIDNDGTFAEAYKSLTFSFTGNDRKVGSFFTKASTSAKQHFILRNSVTVTEVLHIVVTWSAGVPTITASTGVALGAFYQFDGVWRIEGLSTTVTASQAHEFVYYLTDQGVGSQTGQIYAGGFQAENKHYATTYIKTTTTSASRSHETVTLPLPWGMQSFTAMLELYRGGWAHPTSPGGWINTGLHLGGSTSPYAYLAIDCSGAGANVIAAFRDADLTVAPNIPNDGGRIVRALMQVEITPALCQVRQDGGAGFGGWSDPPGTGGIVAWGGSSFYFGCSPFSPGSVSNINAPIIEAAVAPGLWTIAQMRAALEELRP